MDSTIPTIPFRRPNPTIGPYAQPIIARDKVRYYGEPIGIVLADGPELAEDALAAIEVEFDPLPAVVDWATAKKGDVLLFDTTESNIASVFNADRGDPAPALSTGRS